MMTMMSEKEKEKTRSRIIVALKTFITHSIFTILQIKSSNYLLLLQSYKYKSINMWPNNKTISEARERCRWKILSILSFIDWFLAKYPSLTYLFRCCPIES